MIRVFANWSQFNGTNIISFGDAVLHQISTNGMFLVFDIEEADLLVLTLSTGYLFKEYNFESGRHELRDPQIYRFLEKNIGSFYTYGWRKESV
jgi:hypothetical protein